MIFAEGALSSLLEARFLRMEALAGPDSFGPARSFWLDFDTGRRRNGGIALWLGCLGAVG